jgi:hypothetical protein
MSDNGKCEHCGATAHDLTGHECHVGDLCAVVDALKEQIDAIKAVLQKARWRYIEHDAKCACSDCRLSREIDALLGEKGEK